MNLEEKDKLLKAVGFYNGYSAKGNYDVELKMAFNESDLYDAMEFVAGIGRKLKLLAVIGEEKIPLGLWNVYQVRIDHNARCTISFRSNITFVKPENITKLMIDEDFVIKGKIIEEK